MREMLTLVVLLVALSEVFSQEVPVHVRPDDCTLRTGANTPITLRLKVSKNLNRIEKTTFTILGVAVPLDLTVKRNTFIKVTPTALETPCEFAGEGVVIEAAISRVNDPIVVAQSETVEIFKFDGVKDLKMAHAGREFVAISFEVKGEADKQATFTLNHDQKPDVNLPSQKETWVMVPKTRFLDVPEATFDVKMDVGSKGHVVITNAAGLKPTIKQSDKEINFVCFDQKCAFDIEKKKDNILLYVELAANVPAIEKPKLTVDSTKEQVIELQSNVLEVVRVKKDEFGTALSCSFSSLLTNVEKPSTFTIVNSENPDKISINSNVAIYRGKPVTGTYQFGTTGEAKERKMLTLELLSPRRATIQFNIINPAALSPEDLIKAVQLAKEKPPKDLLFFEDEIHNNLQTQVEIKNLLNARIEMKITRKILELEEISPGHSGIIKGPKTVVMRKFQNDFTLILQTMPDSAKPTSTLTIGDDVVEVGQVPKYHYIRREDFDSSKEVLVKLEEDGVEVKYSRIKNIVLRPILKGNHTYKQGGHFNLPVKEAIAGVTLKVKPNIGEVELIVTLGREDADGKPIVLSKKVKTEGEIIYIYPSDINKASNLDVVLTLEEGGSVEINSILGIETIEIKKSGSYIFRKNTVKFNIEKATEDYIMDVKLDVDSPAKSVTFEMEKTNHEIDSPKTITLTKAFLEKKPVPICKFTSNSTDQEAHVHLTIRAASAQTESTQAPTQAPTPAPVCNPACTGNMECKKGGEKNVCECLTGYTGQDCAISGSAGLTQSIAAVLVVSLLPYLLHY